MRTHYDTPDSPLAEQVRVATSTDASREYELLRHRASIARVRFFGGHVLGAQVTTPDTALHQELLHPGSAFSYSGLSQPKLRASHFGLPAGPDGFGIGNKHGAIRYIDHTPMRRSAGSIVLRASLEQVGIIADRTVRIGDSHVQIDDAVTNTRPEGDEATSMLNHLYLNRGSILPSEDRPVLINGEPIDDILHEEGASERIYHGEPRLWTDVADNAITTISMPNGSKVSVTASINDEPVRSALLWAPRGKDAFCFEPVVGYANEHDNRGLIIPARETAILAVTVAAIRGADISQV